MRYFAHTDFPQSHGGATRVTDTMATIGRLAARARSAKGLAGGLVTGGVAAAIVVADQIVSAWADGHLMLAWIAMWLIVFALLAVFSDAIRGWPAALQLRLAAWRADAAARAADERTWEAAKADPRLMADLQFALIRAEQDAAAKGTDRPVWPFANMSTGRQAPADRAWVDASGSFPHSPAQDDPRILADIRAAALHSKSQDDELPVTATAATGTSDHPAQPTRRATNPGFRTSPMPGMPAHMQYLPS